MNRPGYEKLWRHFGLSYAAWITMPRALMHEMPDEWQSKMSDLLDEWSTHYRAPEGLGEAHVVQRVRGRFVAWPDWMTNYRHPDRVAIAALTKASTTDSLPAKEKPSP